VLVFVVPVAGTPEERAAARGIPFSAQALVDEAKRHYANLEKELQGPWAHWQRGWRAKQQRRQARRAAREARRTASAGWPAPDAPTGAPPIPLAPQSTHYARQVATGLVVPVMAFLSAAFTLAWLQLSAMLIVTGTLVGWSPGLPLWAGLLGLLLLAMVITQPINHARTALHRAPYPGDRAWLAAWDGILWLGFMALLGWLVWISPGSHVQALVHDLPGAWEKIRASWQASR
jgi:hypothetical protein